MLSHASEAALRNGGVTAAATTRPLSHASSCRSQKGSKALENGRVCKTGGQTELRKAAGMLRAARSFDAERSCVSTGGANGLEGELCRHRPPSLLPSCTSRAIPRSRCCSGLRWQGEVMSFHLKLLVDAAHVHGAIAAGGNRRCRTRGAAWQAEPRRGSWCRAAAGMHGYMLFHIQKRALLTSTRAHTHSPLTPMAGASQRQLSGSLGPSVACMRARYDTKL